jgi:hypothetical protein
MTLEFALRVNTIHWRLLDSWLWFIEETEQINIRQGKRYGQTLACIALSSWHYRKDQLLLANTNKNAEH